MKVLFIGVYKDGTGWGHAAIDYILALDEAEVDVVPRVVKLNDNKVDLPERITELERKDDSDCNIVIQNILPHMMDYSGEFDKNIALYFTEVSNFSGTNWNSYLNLMDEGWVGCTDSLKHSRNSGVNIPLYVAPVPCDVSKYSKRYEKLDIPDLRDKFVFYFMGEYSRRKNLTALLKAYHLEFCPNEPVALLIKTGSPNMSPAECSKHVVEHCAEVKTQLCLYDRIIDHLDEIIVTDSMNDEQIMQIHTTCDCLIMPSFGEGWNIPAFDAMAMGNTPICTDVGGMHDFMATDKGQEVGWLVPATPSPCFGMKPWTAVPQLYSGHANWWEIDIDYLRQAMRHVFENSKERRERASRGIDHAHNFSHKNIGLHMKKILEGHQTAGTKTVIPKDFHDPTKLLRNKNESSSNHSAAS
jgi:glycosyltransferase involved in cell wall biosynthesis